MNNWWVCAATHDKRLQNDAVVIRLVDKAPGWSMPSCKSTLRKGVRQLQVHMPTEGARAQDLGHRCGHSCSPGRLGTLMWEYLNIMGAECSALKRSVTYTSRHVYPRGFFQLFCEHSQAPGCTCLLVLSPYQSINSASWSSIVWCAGLAQVYSSHCPLPWLSASALRFRIV